MVSRFNLSGWVPIIGCHSWQGDETDLYSWFDGPMYVGPGKIQLDA